MGRWGVATHSICMGCGPTAQGGAVGGVNVFPFAELESYSKVLPAKDTDGKGFGLLFCDTHPPAVCIVDLPGGKNNGKRWKQFTCKR